MPNDPKHADADTYPTNQKEDDQKFFPSDADE